MTTPASAALRLARAISAEWYAAERLAGLPLSERIDRMEPFFLEARSAMAAFRDAERIDRAALAPKPEAAL